MTLDNFQMGVLKQLKGGTIKKYSSLKSPYVMNFANETLKPLVDNDLIEVVKSVGCLDPNNWARYDCGFKITEAGKAILEPKPVEPETNE